MYLHVFSFDNDGSLSELHRIMYVLSILIFVYIGKQFAPVYHILEAPNIYSSIESELGGGSTVPLKNTGIL